MIDSIQHTCQRSGRSVSEVDPRLPATGAVMTLALGVELLTPLPGLRLLLAVAVICAPALLFERFWRGLLWLGDSTGFEAFRRRRGEPDWRGRRVLWFAFGVVWALDLLATVAFFFHPHLRELHPVTVFLYDLAGVPGVVFAGASYAGVVLAVTRALGRPTDFDFLLVATLWYALLVFHNAVLLLGK